MTIQEKVAILMVKAMKEKNEPDRDAYRFIKGNFDQVKDQPVPDEVAIKIIRKLHTDAKANPKTFSPRETSILESLIPENLDAFATMNFIVENELVDQIKSCQREGQAIGIAMKAFSIAKLQVDSDTVKSVVTTIRIAG